jgi:hypothetical protein
MTKLKSRAAVVEAAVSSLSDEDLEAIAEWLQSEEGSLALSKAAAETRQAISELNRARSVDRDDLHKPIVAPDRVIGFGAGLLNTRMG